MIAAISDGPLPVGDFILLCAGTAALGIYAYNYVNNQTAIAQNMGQYHGTQIQNAVNGSIAITSSVLWNFQQGINHYSASRCCETVGGGISVGSPITLVVAQSRAWIALDTFNRNSTYAWQVANALPGTPYAHAKHDYTNNYYTPGNYPHWHSPTNGGHHFYR
ncbi:hypothetical protein [Paenibacillus aceris]|uniref:Uncharacterized protein n=1 Tax=Paenibacillus aceris TaxID=869555 RepID=A0ABS4I6C1_9BACL|nr:hypothetical protein [Paenibacillus aceris]MBP1966275.1 hypothetical protein [Paenibacillus aceris]NHW38536.1 hypothetical protein [Paenibacillus aceris]